MLYILSFGGVRPNRITAVKDEAYHVQYARYCAFSANTPQHSEYQAKYALNKQFYVGNQWVEPEDLEAFLKDESGQLRNRIKAVDNVIKPIVEQYRGNAIRMEYNAKLKSQSKHCINRREQAYAEIMIHDQMARAVPSLRPMLQRRYGVGDSTEETAQIFNNTYVDAYIETMNDLLYFVSNKNDFDAIKFESAIHLALGGICITKNFEYSGHHVFDLRTPDYFFFDHSAKKPDLSDAGYMGEEVPMEATDIYERYPDLTDDQKADIEKWSIQNTTATGSTVLNQTISTNKVPTFLVYWKDVMKSEWGYVLDEFGYPFLTKINFTYPGEDKPRYTSKDLVEVEKHKQKKILGGKLSKQIHTDVIRYCHFVPLEIIGNATSSQEKAKDIVLEYGVLPYQEHDEIEFHSAKFPYNIYTWSYVDGQIYTPIDDAINPQRIINRMKSVAENQVNNSRGSGTIIDKSLISKEGEEQEIVANMNNSKPVFIQGKGRGIQNIVGSYDSTVGQGTKFLYDIIAGISGSIKANTGVNDALQGQPQSADQLVGVTQLMIQRGSLMQEPFYNAIAEMMKRNYQSIATVGKNIYADNERELAISVGDDGAKIIKISKDMKSEVFRAFIKRENMDDVIISANNNLMMQLKAQDMLSDEYVAELWGRASQDNIATYMRRYAKEKIEMRRQAIKNQAAQMDNAQQQLAMQTELQNAQQDKQNIINEKSQTQAENASLMKAKIDADAKKSVAMSKNNTGQQQ